MRRRWRTCDICLAIRVHADGSDIRAAAALSSSGAACARTSQICFSILNSKWYMVFFLLLPPHIRTGALCTLWRCRWRWAKQKPVPARARNQRGLVHAAVKSDYPHKWTRAHNRALSAKCNAGFSGDRYIVVNGPNALVALSVQHCQLDSTGRQFRTLCPCLIAAMTRKNLILYQ